MPVLDLIASSSFGSLLGMRHALEPDHLAAISTLVTRERSSLRAAWLGACWGLGHTVSLMLAGAVLVLLRAEMPLRLAAAFELGVALMLIVLGVRAIRQALALATRGPLTRHQHWFVAHQHAGLMAHVHIGRWTFARRPLLIGAVHGLAGSGALTALVVTTLPSLGSQLTYMALFGIGSTLGMAALSGMLGWPLARLGANLAVARTVSGIVGVTSTGLGLIWGYPLLWQLF